LIGGCSINGIVLICILRDMIQQLCGMHKNREIVFCDYLLFLYLPPVFHFGTVSPPETNPFISFSG
jgi:hypothetical protein